MEGAGGEEPRRFSGAAASTSGGSELAAVAAPRAPTVVRRVIGQQVCTLHWLQNLNVMLCV